MKKELPNGLENLRIVFKDLRDSGKYEYSSRILQEMGVSHATNITPFLERRGYIDLVTRKVKKVIEPNRLIDELKSYCSERQSICNKKARNKKASLKISNGNYVDKFENIENKPEYISLSNMTDIDIVTELRRRGYDVSAKKIIEL